MYKSLGCLIQLLICCLGFPKCVLCTFWVILGNFFYESVLCNFHLSDLEGYRLQGLALFQHVSSCFYAVIPMCGGHEMYISEKLKTSDYSTHPSEQKYSTEEWMNLASSIRLIQQFPNSSYGWCFQILVYFFP